MRTAHIGQTITFHCKYDHKTHTKVFYRLNVGPVHVLNSSQSSQSSEKFILSDSQKDHFNVTIRDISTADSGVYLCGVERHESDDQPSETSNTHITFIKEIHLNVSSQIASVQIQAYISKSVFIKCKFPQKFKGNKKFIQKDSSQKIPVDDQNQWVRHDKVHMYDDTSGGVLKVFISDLTAADEVTYRCGVNINNDEDLFTEIKLTVNQVPPVVGREGDSAEIKCPYDEKYSKEIKRLCKGKCFTQDAKKIIQSDEDHVKKTKVSVKNDTELNLFTVTRTELRAEDAGKYWCAVKGGFNLPIELMIVMKDVITHEASVGGSASISCKYIRNQNRGFFCRGDQINICVRDGVRVSSNNRINGRFSLTDETSAGVFTVNISNLTAEDFGKYWCGEENSGSFILTGVHLHVNGDLTSVQDVCSVEDNDHQEAPSSAPKVPPLLRTSKWRTSSLKIRTVQTARQQMTLDHPSPVPAEVALTVMANQGLCCRYIIELLDWQDNPDHYIMVLARPPPCMDMHDFWEHHGVLFSKVLVHHFMQ
ncbi:polymeric immunoglobulin receptor-like protein [Labeo rohita]|nr:polymeric immunoglobulin receptor-like protein [Labeo rohita]